MFWLTSLPYESRTVTLFVIAFICLYYRPTVSTPEQAEVAEPETEKPLMGRMGQGTGCGMGSDGFRHCEILPKIGDCFVRVCVLLGAICGSAETARSIPMPCYTLLYLSSVNVTSCRWS